MSECVTFLREELVPDKDSVFINQGIPTEAVVPSRIETLYSTALDLLSEAAAPAGLVAEISKADFAAVYQGEGRNEARTPVGDIFTRADSLALFAVTLGEGISRAIEGRFESHAFALACMLDAVASAATDKLAQACERHFVELLSRTGRVTSATSVLAYSPGYCGWDISGQRRLFDALHAERIGIRLSDSCLMQPLKSISGVLIGGPKEIHKFDNGYAFCSRCETQGCRTRLRALFAE